MNVIPDTVDELLELTDQERGADAIFWALTDDDEVIACAPFKIWNSKGEVLAAVHAAGLASKWRVVCEAFSLDYSAEWDDGVPVPAEVGDGIRFHFTFNWQMLT